MGFKEVLSKEKEELRKVKRPYETAAFIIFAVLFIQQILYLILRIIEFIIDIKDAGGNWNPSISTNIPSIPAFVVRIIQIDATKWIFVLLGILGLVLWYYLIYLFVWNYCRKRGFAKWVWTSLIVFGPTSIFLIPVYLIYAVYVFRPYFFRFIKRGVLEYKNFTTDFQFEEDIPEPEIVEEKEPEIIEEEVEEEEVVEEE